MEHILSKIEDKFDIVRADQIYTNGNIVDDIQIRLGEADLVVADLTGANPNVYYEVGYRHALGMEIIIFAEKGTSLPFDVRANRVVFYDLDIDEVKDAQQALVKMVENIKPLPKDTTYMGNDMYMKIPED